jgi:Holliday junction resolvasome RuvABC ATP-dependent DNA helicase subunit
MARLSGEMHRPAKQPKRGDAIFEGVDYPRDWSGFTGQEQAKAQLRAQVASSLSRNARMEHTLLETGLHGVGKTTLATLMTYKRGVGFQQTTGPLSVDEARSLLLAMKDHDVLFIDEAHKLVEGNRTRADWLLPFMTEGMLYTARGAEKMPDVTLVAATTDVGRLPLTLISRFMCRPRFVAYSEAEAEQIVAGLAVRMGIDAEVDYARIARAANRNPRDARMILTQVRELAFAYPDQSVDLDTAFEWAGLSADGLGRVARDMLLVLLGSSDFTASIDTIGAQLGEPGPLKHHEQALLQHGLIEITGRGRKLTEDGVQRAARLLEENAA